MSVAIIAQGGAVLGYLLMHRKNVKTRELCIPSFISVLFGITEPALFGINLRYRFPIIGGCIGGALGGVAVYMTDLAAVGFGITVLPGIALADPAGNGYVNYIIAHAVAIAGGFIMTLVLGKFMDKTPADAVPSGTQGLPDAGQRGTDAAQGCQEAEPESPAEEIFYGYANGQLIAMEDVKDETFANKVLGEGVAVLPTDGRVYAPADGMVMSVFDTKHAICFASRYGTEILIHIGVDTVNLKGEGFTSLVKAQEKVKAGTELIRFDREALEAKGYCMEVMQIVMEGETASRVQYETGMEACAGRTVVAHWHS